MELQQIDNAAVIAEFKIRKKKQFTVVLPLVILMIGLLAMSDNPEFTLFELPRSVLYAVAAVGIIGGIIFSLKNWRCPACSAYLRKNISPKFCPSCGIKLQSK